ncbi:hypothetical protein WA026_005174 [Henosepilachna vigintioctopunctata]|uniref:Pinin n=1 Tax=Henosepilachna vigintioctopunctata TaxID=420089 RepID=A0AAW1UWB1_9CUCU
MTDILKSFNTLQSELELAKSSLKGVDENIKRLIGRDPSEVPTRQAVKRPISIQHEDRGRPKALMSQNEDRRLKNSGLRMLVQENEEIPIKKRSTGISVFKRLSDRPIPLDNKTKQSKGMISKVIVTPKEIPSRQERMEAQSRDITSVARNKRMFGALLGTLQKFQQEETKLKKKEEKRAQLEKKIEEHEIKEKEEIKKERQELFFNRKKKQAEIKMIELKMIRMKEYAAWEDSQKQRMNFIYTKTKPHIHFLPRKLKDTHKELLDNSKVEIQSIINKKREEIQEELAHIEDRGRKIFEPRKFQHGIKKVDETFHDDGTEEENMNMEVSHEEKCEESIVDNNYSISDAVRDDSGEIQSTEEICNGNTSLNTIEPQYTDLLQENIPGVTSCKNIDVLNNINEQNIEVNEFNHTNYVINSSSEKTVGNNLNESNIVVQHTNGNVNY